MYISSLHIERFGDWTDVRLNGFCGALDVIHSSTDSGAADVVRFIRGMLFGFDGDVAGTRVSERREPTSRRTSTGLGGELTMQAARGPLTICRSGEGRQQDRVNITRADGLVLGERHLQDLLAGVRPEVFQRVFIVSPQAATDIRPLIDATVAYGFSLVGGYGDSSRLAELKDQLLRHRLSLDALAMPEASGDDLSHRLRTLSREIDDLHASRRQRSVSLDRQRRKLDGEIAELEEQIEGLQEELSALDNRIGPLEVARDQMEAALHHAKLLADRRLAENRAALAEIDTQLERWRHVLLDIEARSRRLLNEGVLAEPHEALAEGDPRPYLRRLEERIEQLQESLADGDPTEMPDRCDSQAWRAVWSPALETMRDDVYRLCNELSRSEASSRHFRTSNEFGQLRRCEAELRSAVAALSLRRQKLFADISQTLADASAILHPAHVALCQCKEHTAEIERRMSTGGTPMPDEEELSRLRAEIEALSAQRQQVRDDIAAAIGAVEQRQQRRQELEADLDAEDRRLQAQRDEMEQVERRLRLVEDRRQLLHAIARLEDEIRAAEASVESPALLREASDLLRRLTAGEFDRMAVTPQHGVCVYGRTGARLGYEQLGAVARGQVYLSLSLAVVAAYARGGTRLPLLLDEMLPADDPRGAETAAALLRDFCQRGHQVLLFTRRPGIAQLFARLQVPVHHLPAPHAVPAPQPVAVAETPAATDERRLEVNRFLNRVADEMQTPVEPAERPAWNAEEFPGELTDRVRPQKAAEPAPSPSTDRPENPAEFFLLETSPIKDAPSVDAATAERFRKIGVLCIRDLLQLDVVPAADRLRYAGITAGMLRRWQAEALLACRVPRLRCYDARILVACGITAPEQLARTDAEELRQRVESFAATGVGQVLLRAGNPYELTRLTEWIRSAQGRPSRQAVPRPPLVSLPRRSQARERLRPRESQAPRHADSARHAPRLAASEGNGTAGDHPVVVKLEPDVEKLRFYLNLSDPIEQAPSIGPRTAERLIALGIKSVADFLRADPAATAAGLRRRHVGPETIRAWQQQAALICRVPRLRGHDAQILVACGIHDAEALGQANADELWKTVEPFVAGKEGSHMLRGAKAPDLREVQTWIQCARDARQLKAA